MAWVAYFLKVKLVSDLVAIVIFVGGTATFIASLFYVRAYYQYRSTTKDLFKWNPDPRATRVEFSVLEEELATAVEKGQIDKATAIQIAKGALRDRDLDPSYEERLLRRLLNASPR